MDDSRKNDLLSTFFNLRVELNSIRLEYKCDCMWFEMMPSVFGIHSDFCRTEFVWIILRYRLHSFIHSFIHPINLCITLIMIMFTITITIIMVIMAWIMFGWSLAPQLFFLVLPYNFCGFPCRTWIRRWRRWRRGRRRRPLVGFYGPTNVGLWLRLCVVCWSFVGFYCDDDYNDCMNCCAMCWGKHQSQGSEKSEKRRENHCTEHRWMDIMMVNWWPCNKQFNCHRITVMNDEIVL